MSHTEDFEHLLDLDNATAVDYDEDDDSVTVFVTRKVGEEELDEDQVVGNNVEKESHVEEIGEVRALDFEDDMPDALGARHNKHRPVPGGVSEINVNSTAATGGPYKAEVVDTSRGEWADGVSEGDIVRISNAHVYARSGKARFGEPIVQPSPYDGGGIEDQVGELAGYVPVEDGMKVDAAARTSDGEDTTDYHNIDGYPQGVYRGDWRGKKGAELLKTGRTTGVTRANVRATSASIRVKYRDVGVVTVRDCVVAGDMSDGGDSGSPAFFTESKELAALNFAGSPEVSILSKIANVEESLGVKFLTDDDGENKKYVQSLKTTVSIDMEAPDLDLEEFRGDKPIADEVITATAVVSGNYPGAAYLDVQGQRYEFELGEDYTAEVAVEIEAPDEYQESFDVTITGGYIQ